MALLVLCCRHTGPAEEHLWFEAAHSEQLKPLFSHGSTLTAPAVLQQCHLADEH